MNSSPSNSSAASATTAAAAGSSSSPPSSAMTPSSSQPHTSMNSGTSTKTDRIRPKSKTKNISLFQIPKSKIQFRLYLHHLTLTCCDLAFRCADQAMYLLGPILIVVASAIIAFLTYAYFWIVLPMLSGTNWVVSEKDLEEFRRERGWFARDVDADADGNNANGDVPISMLMHLVLGLTTPTGIAHTSIVLFFLVNILYNYFKCVTTSNSGPSFDLVVRELARETGFEYPETEEEMARCKRDMERRILERVERRRKEIRQGGYRISGEGVAAVATSAAVAAIESDRGNGSDFGSGNVGGTASKGSNSTTYSPVGKGSNFDEESQISPLMANSTKQQNSSYNNQTQSILQPLQMMDQQYLQNSQKHQPQQTQQQHQQQPIQNHKPIPLPKIHNWQLLSPTEWSYCRNSHQPKPPRSHFDHVTNALVLNMDHYCPWMFNTVGYFNYRYFFNFLCFVTTGLFYGMCICLRPFLHLSGWAYRHQIRESGGYQVSLRQIKVVHHLKKNSFIPTPDERSAVAFAFMLCLAVGLAVLCLAGFHLYLVLSAQSTIEFHGNCAKRRRKTNGVPWKNPYSVGWRGNWQFIYGKKSRSGFGGMITGMLPSGREPEYLPIPINGTLVRRKNFGGAKSKKVDVEMGSAKDKRGGSGGSGSGLIVRGGRQNNERCNEHIV